MTGPDQRAPRATRPDSIDESSENAAATAKAPPTLATWTGPANSAPYPLSRMAPAFSLVNVAAEIEKADDFIATSAGGKLELIARQMRALREQAELLLEGAKRDAELHRVRCNFEKRPGGVYHLYQRQNGEQYFSRIGPEEWSSSPAQTFEGSYRMEADRSFTPLEQCAPRDAERAHLLSLVVETRQEER